MPAFPLLFDVSGRVERKRQQVSRDGRRRTTIRMTPSVDHVKTPDGATSRLSGLPGLVGMMTHSNISKSDASSDPYCGKWNELSSERSGSEQWTRIIIKIGNYTRSNKLRTIGIRMQVVFGLALGIQHSDAISGVSVCCL